jgi:hypothetical protein
MSAGTADHACVDSLGRYCGVFRLRQIVPAFPPTQSQQEHLLRRLRNQRRLAGGAGASAATKAKYCNKPQECEDIQRQLTTSSIVHSQSGYPRDLSLIVNVIGNRRRDNVSSRFLPVLSLDTLKLQLIWSMLDNQSA